MGRKNSPSAKKQLATLITNYEKAKAENRQLYLDADPVSYTHLDVYKRQQLWVSKYNAIYGSFAALPLFLLWLQICLLYTSSNCFFFNLTNALTCEAKFIADFF